ncbi:MAG: type II/IV secretion system ATPase subunit, partial [Methanocella sp.]
MTGSGNSGLDLNDHDADRKNFYGLLKKKQGTTSEEKKATPEAAPSAPPAVGTAPDKASYPVPDKASELRALESVISQTAPVHEPVAESAPKAAHDFSAWTALAKTKADKNAGAPLADEGQEPEELKRILEKSATFSPREAASATAPVIPDAPSHHPAPAAPASRPAANFLSTYEERTDDRMVSSTEINAVRDNRSEEDILEEFNAIISKSQGADLAATKKEEEDNKKKKPAKAKKKPKVKVEFEPYDLEKHGAMATFTSMPGYEEIERYWVVEPYAFVVVLYNELGNAYLYYVCEPSLTVFEKELLEDVYQRLQDLLILDNIDAKMDRKEVLVRKATEIIVDYIGKVETKSYHKIIYYIVRDYLEYGKITPIMHDNFIEDISNNGFDTPIFLYHKNYENIMTNIMFNEKQLDSFVIRLAQRCGKHISIAEPMIDATMPEGSRIQMTLGKEITTRGSTFTIRKFKEIPITPIDLIAWNTFSSETMSYLWMCIENNKSLIFSGGTASGKTSSLNAVSLFIPPKAKIISLEDTRELKLPHQNWIPGLTRDSFTADGKGSIEMFALLKAALRQRPEYLLVGEVRGKEALTLFQAMSTG